MSTSIQPDAMDATAEVFITAFKALPEKARDRVLQMLFESEDLRDQIEGALLFEERKNGNYRPFREYLKKHAEPS